MNSPENHVSALLYKADDLNRTDDRLITNLRITYFPMIIVPEVTVLWKLVFDNKKNPCRFMSVDDQEHIQSLKLLAYAPDGIINFFDLTERPIVRKYINALKASNNSNANLSQSTLLWQKPGISRSSSADQPTPTSVAGRF